MAKIRVGNRNFVVRESNNDGRRKEYPPVEKYESGSIKSLDLDNVTPIIINEYKYMAEKVVFYEDGNVKRIFPRNGRLSAFWTEEDEYKISEEFYFKFDFAEFKRKVISLKFYKSGKIAAVTLWPKDYVRIKIKDNLVKTRIGFTIYENGKIKSLEPCEPYEIATPIGKIEAYDPEALGVSGEYNSLNFNEDGSVKSLSTSANIITVYTNEIKKVFSPKEEYLFTNDEMKHMIPIRVKFEHPKVIINNNDCFDISKSKFIITRFKEKTLFL